VSGQFQALAAYECHYNFLPPPKEGGEKENLNMKIERCNSTHTLKTYRLNG
jgi:hypothetical protein